MSNDREAAVVARSTGDAQAGSTDTSSSAQEQNIDLIALPDPANFDLRQVGWDYRNDASRTEENSKK